MALLALLLACDGGLPPDTGDRAASCYDAAAVAEIGGTIEGEDGRETWAPAVEGAELTMVHGPQGGWHVLASLRATNTDPVVAITYRVLVLPEESVVSHNELRVQLVADEACSGYYPGMYGYLDVSALAEGAADTPPELLAGKELLLTMDVVDAEGRAASDTLHAVAALDPADEDG